MDQRVELGFAVPLPSPAVACALPCSRLPIDKHCNVGRSISEPHDRNAHLIDVRHLGRERVIGCWSLGGALVDPGPESCIETLLDGLDAEPAALLLTHIHLDHAGASGALVERFPDLDVCVHETARPTSWIPRGCCRARSASTATTWTGSGAGSCRSRSEPARPAGGETITVAGREIEVLYTPGHASHHVVYLDRSDRTAYVGDVGGVRIPPADSSAADAAAGHRRRGCGRTRSRRRGTAARVPRVDPLRRCRRTRRRIWSAWRRRAGRAGRAGPGLLEEVEDGEEEQASLVRRGDSSAQTRRVDATSRRLCASSRRAPAGAAVGRRFDVSGEAGCERRTAGSRWRRRRSRSHASAAREPEREARWRVIVLNDNHNTFDHVANTLARVIPSVSLDRGYKIADQIHNAGPGDRVDRRAGAGRALLGATPGSGPHDGAAGKGLSLSPASSTSPQWGSTGWP